MECSLYSDVYVCVWLENGKGAQGVTFGLYDSWKELIFKCPAYLKQRHSQIDADINE